MQELLKPKSYPVEAKRAIFSQSSLGVAIANRWMLGWPGRVKKLLETGEYAEALTSQVETERFVLASTADMTHLAQHEIMEMYGLNPAPPLID